MKKLFDELSQQVSVLTTRKYSTSFSLGILALHPSIRPSIYSIYGFVRLADEIVDSFHDFDKKKLLYQLKENTWEAIDTGISINPILQSFQHTVNEYKINPTLIEQFFKSMEMDLQKIEYDSDMFKQYILGSAEVVGLMCLQVFVGGDEQKYTQLKPYAMKLGSAFQKVNFLRDLNDDFHSLGRAYFPTIDLQSFDHKCKKEIESDIEQDFQEALIGIKKLPAVAQFGVYLAYRYYYSLFKKICNTPAECILSKRIRIPNVQKFSLAMSSYLQHKIAIY